MTSGYRVDDSPFRETQWDAKLDRMLDDLNSSVDGEGGKERSSSFRSRSESRLENRQQMHSEARTRSGSALGLTDGWVSRRRPRDEGLDSSLVKRSRDEYTSPDKSTHVVREKYEYDVGDQSEGYQKKVMKSTYSSFSKGTDETDLNFGGTRVTTSNLDEPSEYPNSARVREEQKETFSSSSKVLKGDTAYASKEYEPPIQQVEPVRPGLKGPETDESPRMNGTTSSSQQQHTSSSNTRYTTRTEKRSYNTISSGSNQSSRLTENRSTTATQDLPALRAPHVPVNTTSLDRSTHQLKQNISELDSIIYDLDKTSRQIPKRMRSISPQRKSPSPARTPPRRALSQPRHYSPEKSPLVTSTPIAPRASHQQRQETRVSESNHVSMSSTTNKSTKSPEKEQRPPNKLNSDGEWVDGNTGEVRRVVWKNRFEKTYNLQDTTNRRVPEMTIEEAALLPPNTTPSTQTPSQVSPASSWQDPVPLPSPPQMTPPEPGTAYACTVGNTPGQGVTHIPPLPYASIPAPASIPSEGAPSPTPSSVTNQPIIYHYSYHYTLQPGQTVPEGVPNPPAGAQPFPATVHSPPTQVVQNVSSAPQPPTKNTSSSSYNYLTSSSTNRNITNTSKTTNITNMTNVNNSRDPNNSGPPYGTPAIPNYDPKDSHPQYGPGSPNGPNSNVSITINKKTTTHTSHSTDGGPPTSRRSRSRSPSPERRRPYPNGGFSPPGDYPHRHHSPYPDGDPNSPNGHKPGSPGGPHVTINRYDYHYGSDSTERLRRPRHEPLPFPDTTPLKPATTNRIPRRVDDLMTSFSDSEDGPDRGPRYRGQPPSRSISKEAEPLLPHGHLKVDVEASADAKAKADAEQRTPTKPLAGPAVYYPPGHELFKNTPAMHTMTLKEGKGKGKGKWSMQKSSGYKESSSSSESKGGAVMVPVCLPLCCGAACVVM